MPATADPTPRFRVLLVDDERLIRSGLALILRSADDIEVVATCEGGEAMEAVRRLRPDVVLLDIRMPDIDGLTLLPRILELPGPPHVAMLTTFDHDDYLSRAIALGAGGFLLKDTEPDTLIRSVRALATGAGCLSPSVVRRLHGGLTPDARAQAATEAVARLTPREREVLGYIGQGLSNGEIGARMHFSVATAKDDVSTILGKIDVANRVQAAVIAERAGLLAPDAEQATGNSAHDREPAGNPHRPTTPWGVRP
ncbi:response regulator [Streptomyces wedmorensis]